MRFILKHSLTTTYLTGEQEIYMRINIGEYLCI